MVENSARMRQPEISTKKKHFFEVHVSLRYETNFLKNHVSNEMHFWSIHRVIKMLCAYSHYDVCRPLERGAQTMNGLEIKLPRRNFDPPDTPKGPIPTKNGAHKRGTIPCFETRKGPRASWPPWTSYTDDSP